jgi:hypothetical protein
MAISSELVSAINISGNLHPTKIIICAGQDDIGCIAVAIGSRGRSCKPCVRVVDEHGRYAITRPGNNGYPYGWISAIWPAGTCQGVTVLSVKCCFHWRQNNRN